MPSCVLPSPVGGLLLAQEGDALIRIDWTDQAPLPPSTPLLRCAVQQLNAYFAGQLTQFDLPLSPEGTAFQRAVWAQLCQIPYGQTCTYGEIAARMGRPRAARAVGMANHRNPLPILIPCHRVIGASGELTGYAGGLEKKQTLLALEGCRLSLPTHR